MKLSPGETLTCVRGKFTRPVAAVVTAVVRRVAKEFCLGNGHNRKGLAQVTRELPS